MKCTLPSECGSPDDFYSLRPLASSSAPATIPELKAWLAKHHHEGRWFGKLYVSSTVSWNAAPAEFHQSGCSPNYQAKHWSLACCMRHMRRARVFKKQMAELVPIFIFTLAKTCPEKFQSLVSVAKVTQPFCTMEQYAQFLLVRGEESLLSSRLTRVRTDDGLLGWRFGDCHANRAGTVGSPNPKHVHAKPQELWQEDNDGTHLILFSEPEEFLVWEEPIFITRQTQTQKRYGVNVTAESLSNTFKLL